MKIYRCHIIYQHYVKLKSMGKVLACTQMKSVEVRIIQGLHHCIHQGF